MKYTLYKQDNSRKLKVRGFWIDDKTGKVYKDNILPVKYKTRHRLTQGIKKLLAQGQEAVFYTADKIGYCIDKNGQKTVYNKRLLLKRSRLSSQEFKQLLKHYGGFTVYKIKSEYKIEVYKK